MVTAKLYIEGGGDSREQSIRFREAWNGFFTSAGVGARTQIVRGADANRRSIAEMIGTDLLAPETIRHF